jgi:OmpA-OmpF porin, OOP family
MKKINLMLLATMVTIVAFSQTTNLKKKPSLGVSFSMKDFATPALIRATSFSDVLKDNQWTKLGKMAPGLTVQYFEGLTNHIDFMGGLHGSFVDYPFQPNTISSQGQDKFLVELDASLNFKLLTDNYCVVPYISGGLGASMYAGKYFAAYFPIGAGLQFNLGAATFLNLQYNNNVSVTDNSTTNFNYRLGFASPLKDNAEPVAAKVTPPAPVKEVVAVVEEKDTDGDGIVDSKDKCPTIKGLAKYNGCPIPDTDKDGINDEEDKCPTVAGTAKYNGCPIPDSDNDGVNDEEDKCPTVAGVARYKGCPIPDTDKDGVNDEEDKCPTTVGTVANKGCPELSQYNFETKNIQFKTGSAELTTKGTAELNKLVAILKAHTEIKKISIEGHTDNTGKADKNMILSEKRVAAAKMFLSKKGIDVSRVTTQGYGDTKPIADNTTADGKQQNRRVEVYVTE